MIPFILDIFEVQTIEEHFTLVRVIKALQKGNDRAFAASRSSNKGHNLIGFYLNINALQHLNIFLGRIAELDVFELEVSFLILW